MDTIRRPYGAAPEAGNRPAWMSVAKGYASGGEVLASDPFSYEALQQAGAAGGMNYSWITPEKWAAMPPLQKWQYMDTAGGLPNDIQTTYGIRPTQDAVEAYSKQFGTPAGQLSVSYGPPTFYGHSAQEALKDPSKVVKLPDGRYVFDNSNVNEQVYNQWKNQDEHSGMDLTPLKGIAFVLGAGALGGALGLEAGVAPVGEEGAISGGGAAFGPGASAGAGAAGSVGTTGTGAPGNNVVAANTTDVPVGEEPYTGLEPGGEPPPTGGGSPEINGPETGGGGGAGPGGGAGSDIGSGGLTPEQVTQLSQSNPSLMDQITSGARSAGSSVADFLRANPTLARLAGAAILAATSHNGNSGNAPSNTQNGAVTAAQSHALDLQNQLTEEFLNNYKQNYLPYQAAQIAEANAIGGEDDQNRARTSAIGNVAATYGSARSQIGRNMARYGVSDPAKLASAYDAEGLAEAGARAGQSNVATNAAIQAGREARARLFSTMSGIPSSASSAAAANSGATNAAANTGLTASAYNNYLRQQQLAGAGNLISGAANWLTSNTGGGSGASITDPVTGADGYEVFAADGARIIDGHSERVPDGTDGGSVEGPGTETSDSIPARLSQGELVINADSVKMIDEVAPGLLDKVNQLGLKKRAMSSGVMVH